jgi:thymidylate kinase
MQRKLTTMAHKQLTISLSGVSGSGKTITAELLHAFFTQNGVQSKLQHAPDRTSVIGPHSQASITEHLREHVNVLIVDYQT